MEIIRKPRLIGQILNDRSNVDKVQSKPYNLQVWKIHGKMPGAQSKELLFVELSDNYVTIPALISPSPTSAHNQDDNVETGIVISTTNAKLMYHLMSSGKKIGVHLLAEEYSIKADGTATNPELKSVNNHKKIREWLHELEKALSAKSGDLLPENLINLDDLARQVTQAEELNSNDPDAKMEIDCDDSNETDAEILLDIANGGNQRLHSSECPSSPSSKRAKLLPFEATTQANTDAPKDGINFGWDDCKYVEDFECVIPEDQQRILSMINGWNLREATPQSTPQLRISSNLVEVLCNVECKPIPVPQNNVNKNTNKQESMDFLISRCVGQRHALHSACTPISFTTI